MGRWVSEEEQCSEKDASKEYFGFSPVLPQVILFLFYSSSTSSQSRLEHTGLWEVGFYPRPWLRFIFFPFYIYTRPEREG